MPVQPHRIDPRGARFSAAITAVLLAISLAFGAGSPIALVFLAIQVVAFAAGALLGPGFQPWAVLYATTVRPHLNGPAQWEDARPPRFAQAVGLAFGLLGLLGYVTGWSVLFFVAVGFALIAALLNAAFALCLGCELYLWLARLRRRTTTTGQAS